MDITNEEIARCLEIKNNCERAMNEIIKVRKRIGKPVDEKTRKRIEENVKYHLGYDSHVEDVLKNYKTKL